MNKRIYMANYARKVFAAAVRRALGKDGVELLKQKKIKVVCIDGEWWALDMDPAKGKDEKYGKQ